MKLSESKKVNLFYLLPNIEVKYVNYLGQESSEVDDTGGCLQVAIVWHLLHVRGDASFYGSLHKSLCRACPA